MTKFLLVSLILILALNCKPYSSVSPKDENGPITIKLTDTLRAKPPLNMEYDKWVSAYPNMKSLKAMGGDYDSKNGIKFRVSIGDKNQNGTFGEIGKDFIYLTEYNEMYFEWDNSCSAVSKVQPKTIINYKNNCFVVDSISPAGSFVSLKKVPCSEQANLWERIDLPLEQKMGLIDETEASIQDYLKQYPEKVEYVFVNFWAPWCAPCIEEIPQLQTLYKNNVAIINIVEEFSYEDAKAAITKYAMPGLQIIGVEPISKLFNHCGKGFPYGILYKRNKEISRGVRAHQVLKQIAKP